MIFGFVLSFFKIFHISAICNVVYYPFFTRKPLFKKNNSLTTPFLLCSCFHMHLLLKILGGTDAWAVPHLKFWGTVPQFPLGLRPPVSTGILPHSLPEWAFRARPGLWRICLCPKVARIAEQKFGSR